MRQQTHDPIVVYIYIYRDIILFDGSLLTNIGMKIVPCILYIVYHHGTYHASW